MIECLCPVAGWCELLKRKQTPHHHHLCQTRKDYRQLFIELRDKQPVTDQKVPLQKLDCPHRGLQIRLEKNILCGCADNQEPIYSCLKYLECSARKYKFNQSIPNCLDCQLTGRHLEGSGDESLSSGVSG